MHPPSVLASHLFRLVVVAHKVDLWLTDVLSDTLARVTLQ